MIARLLLGCVLGMTLVTFSPGANAKQLFDPTSGQGGGGGGGSGGSEASLEARTDKLELRLASLLFREGALDLRRGNSEGNADIALANEIIAEFVSDH
jgi:hypothetical protein